MNKEDMINELNQEENEEPMTEWIEDHKKDMQEEYCKMNDDFNEYCKKQFMRATEWKNKLNLKT